MPQEHNERRLWSCFWMSSLDLRQRSNSSSFQILCPLKYVLLQVIIIFYLESKSLEMGLEEYPVKSQQEKRGHQGSEISNDPEGNQGLTNNPGKESVSVVCDTKMSCASDKQRTLSSSEKWEPEPDCKEMRNVFIPPYILGTGLLSLLCLISIISTQASLHETMKASWKSTCYLLLYT